MIVACQLQTLSHRLLIAWIASEQMQAHHWNLHFRRYLKWQSPWLHYWQCRASKLIDLLLICIDDVAILPEAGSQLGDLLPVLCKASVLLLEQEVLKTILDS